MIEIIPIICLIYLVSRGGWAIYQNGKLRDQLNLLDNRQNRLDSRLATLEIHEDKMYEYINNRWDELDKRLNLSIQRWKDSTDEELQLIHDHYRAVIKTLEDTANELPLGLNDDINRRIYNAYVQAARVPGSPVDPFGT